MISLHARARLAAVPHNGTLQSCWQPQASLDGMNWFEVTLQVFHHERCETEQEALERAKAYIRAEGYQVYGEEKANKS